MGRAPTALVTGASRGIGRGIAEALAAAGYALALNYRADRESAEAARRAAIERGAPRVELFQADVADLRQARGMADAAAGALGRIDVLVNNAGVAPSPRLDLLETTPESFDRLVGTNLRGPFFLTQAVARAMIETAGTGGERGRSIVFITSISSEAASVERGEYCVAKAGLSMAARLFAVRLAGFGIPVFEVRPGLIATDMTAPARSTHEQRIADGLVPIRRWGTPADVGRVVASLVGGCLPYSTGQVIYVDGGMHVPRL